MVGVEDDTHAPVDISNRLARHSCTSEDRDGGVDEKRVGRLMAEY